jgi:magnesium-transporting ATPase (P-type)
LILTLAAFFGMKSQGATDALARTAAVNAITVGQVFFLLNSRFKIGSSLSLAAHKGNRYLLMGIGAVAVLQLLFTYAPPLQVVFGTAPLPLWLWPLLLLGGAAFFLLVEAEKAVIRSRRTVQMAPASA